MTDKTRPKLGVIQGNPNAPDKPERIARLAQPGEVLLPRAVFYCQDLKPTTRLVAGWLYDHMKPGTHTATGGQDKIAQELGISRPTVLSALDELWAKHVIMKVERHQKKGGGYYLSYEMRVFLDEKPRKINRPKLKLPKVAKKKVVKPIPSVDPKCPKCNGTGWAYVDGAPGVQRCECGLLKQQHLNKGYYYRN